MEGKNFFLQSVDFSLKGTYFSILESKISYIGNKMICNLYFKERYRLEVPVPGCSLHKQERNCLAITYRNDEGPLEFSKVLWEKTQSKKVIFATKLVYRLG